MTNPFVLLLILMVGYYITDTHEQEMKRARAEALAECQSEEG